MSVSGEWIQAMIWSIIYIYGILKVGEYKVPNLITQKWKHLCARSCISLRYSPPLPKRDLHVMSVFIVAGFRVMEDQGSRINNNEKTDLPKPFITPEKEAFVSFITLGDYLKHGSKVGCACVGSNLRAKSLFTNCKYSPMLCRK